MYRMSHGSFTKLCSILHPHLSMNAECSSLGTKKGPITTEIAIHCLLRWMAGGSYLYIWLCAGVSRSSYYLCVYIRISAILQCKELAYSFPIQNESIKIAANKWKELIGICDIGSTRERWFDNTTPGTWYKEGNGEMELVPLPATVEENMWEARDKLVCIEVSSIRCLCLSRTEEV
jgi:hypothetical protein